MSREGGGGALRSQRGGSNLNRTRRARSPVEGWGFGGFLWGGGGGEGGGGGGGVGGGGVVVVCGGVGGGERNGVQKNIRVESCLNHAGENLPNASFEHEKESRDR